MTLVAGVWPFRSELCPGVLDMAVIDESEELDKLYLIPLECHIGAPEFSEKKFKEWLKWIEGEPAARLILMGDIIEFATKRSVGDVYSQALAPEQQMEYAIDLLFPLRGRIYGTISGNHEMRCYRETSIDPAKWIARALGAPYFRDGQGVIKVRLGRGPNGKPVAYTIHFAHGRSGARTPGGKLSAVWRMTDVVANADVYIGGHGHGLVQGRQDRLVVDPHNNTVRAEKYYVVMAGSLLEYASYAKQAVMAPLGIGAPRIRLDGRRKSVHISL